MMQILGILLRVYMLLGILTFIWGYFISPNGFGLLYSILRSIIWPDVWFDLGIGKAIMGTIFGAYLLKVSIKGR